MLYILAVESNNNYIYDTIVQMLNKRKPLSEYCKNVIIQSYGRRILLCVY